MPALVQSKQGFGSGTSLTVTLSTATTSGNCLVVMAGAVTSAVSGITLGGAAGNFTRLVHVSAQYPVSCWADPGCAGGQTAVAVTFAATDTGFVTVYEVAGLTASPLDLNASASSASSSSFHSLTGTTTAEAEFWVGAVLDATYAPTGPASPWTNLAAASSGGHQWMSGSQITTATGAANYAGTFTTSTAYQAVAVTLIGSTGTPAAPPVLAAHASFPAALISTGTVAFTGAAGITENVCLADGTAIGLWDVYWGSVADGGCTEITNDGAVTGVLQLQPAVATSSGVTHSSLTTGPQNGSSAATAQVQMRTVAQLRTGSTPNNWETGWVFWDFSYPGSLTNCYYYTIKETGTEFGRLNAGVQSILATTGTNYNPALWHTVKVVVSGTTHSIYVDGSGTADISYTDSSGSALSSGAVACYCEDSRVNFANWSLVTDRKSTRLNSSHLGISYA